MKTKIFINRFSVVLLLFTITILQGQVFADTPDELVEQGKNELFNNEDPWTALIKFNQALAQDSNHQKANFWRAVTVSFSNTKLIALLQSLDIIDASNKWLIFDAEGELSYNPFISGEDIIKDDSDAEYIGAWQTAAGAGGFNDSYHWREAGAGATATWTPVIPANGKYQVYARWVTLDGNTTTAAYTINPAVGASQTITVDQSHDSDKWISLGIYEFNSGAGNTIKLAGSLDGKVVADAIKVVPLRPYPNLTEAQDLLTSLVDPPGEQIEQALANLSHVDNTFSDTINLSDSDTMHLDYGEVKAVETLFYLTKTLTNINAAYNMNNADILKIVLLDPDPISLLNEYTDAGKLLPGAASRLGEAKIALENAIASYLAASHYIRNVRRDNDGLNHLIRFYPLYDPEAYANQEEWEDERDDALAMEEDIRNFLNDINDNLTEHGSKPRVKLFFPKDEDGNTMDPGIDIVDFYEFFTDPKDIRVFIDGLLEDDIIRDNLADPVFGGVFPEMTPPDWNYLLGNGPNFKDDPTVRWNGDAPLVELKWKKVLDQHEAAFLRYKIYRSTTPDVDSSSDLVETIDNPLTDTFTDDTIDGLSNFYYYRLYTYYDFDGETAETYSDVGKVILRVYVDAGYAGGGEDGNKEHPFSDLGDAIDEASNGTKVCVARGAYHESDASLRMWNKDGLVLEGGYESTNWTRDVEANVTTIDGTGQGGWNVVSFNNVVGGILDGFTIIGGLMRDGACGIQLSRAVSIVIRNCKIINNERGIGIWDMSSGKVENCLITGSAHQGIQVDMSSLEISDSTISGNDTNLEEWTSAIDVYHRGALTAARLDVSRNNGRGITLSNFSSFDIKDSRIAGNLGRGFDSRNSYGKFFNNLVVNNGKTGINCGGFDEEGRVFAENNTVVGNGENGGIVCERAFPWLELDSQRGGEYFTSAGNWAKFFDGNANWGEYLLCEAGSGAFARWTPDIKTAGAYKVYATWVVGAAHSSDAEYEIRYDGGAVTVSVDQKTGTTGWQGQLLGQYRFAQGKAGSIVLHQSSSGQVVADAVKLEYISSGSETFAPVFRNNIVAGNNGGSNKRGINSYAGANPVVSYNDVYGNTDGDYAGAYTNGGGNISIDPKFVDGPLDKYYLSQTASWQSEDSPCVDAGDPAENLSDANYTTRTNGQADTGRVDMGYHYPAELNSLSAVVINEFLPDPVGGDAGGEWVELYNRSDSPIDIVGCWIDDEIGDGTGSPQEIPSGTIIAGRGYYSMTLPGNGYLDNTVDTVNLLWPNGETRIDSYTYDSTTEGHSYYRYVGGGNWAGDMDNTPTRNAANDGPNPRYYPLSYATIQEGIDNAQSGDTIGIHPATYTENITLKEGVSLVGVGGEPVIVNGKVTMASNSSIEKMTFDYEIPNTAPHVMLNITASNVTVKDCNFRLYQNQPRRGLKTDNLANISGDNITLEGNDFYFESSSSRFMKGIYANQCTNLTMRGNRIHLKGDTAQLSYYLNGVSLVSADNITFENNIIHLESNNAWTLNGLMLNACDNALVKNNTVYIKSTRPYVSQFNGISANQVPHANIRNNIINFETDLQNSYYNYYPYSTYLKPCSIIGNTLTGDTNISLTYNIYNIGYAFLSKSPATLAVTDDSNIKGDPQFVDKDSGDFHLTEDSIAIDRGDPNDDYSKEPEPNGGRINCGSYGNTQEATTTPAHIATHVIFASSLEGGNITPKGSILVTDGDDQTFTIMPSYYYSILDVLLDDVSESVTGNTYTLDNVTQDHTIKARFTPKPTVTITAQGGNGGYISPSGNVKVVIGDSYTFYIRPDEGYRIKDVLVDGAPVGSVTSYEFTDLSLNHIIEAVFASCGEDTD